MRNKRAQVAVETLMIYGVTLLIVIIAIGVLFATGAFDLGSLIPDKCQIEGVAIECDDYFVAQDEVRFRLKNNIGENIVIRSISVQGEGNNLGMWGSQCGFNYDYTDNGVADVSGSPALDHDFSGDGNVDSVRLINGESITLTLASDTVPNGCAIEIPSGKKIEGKFEVWYGIIGSDIEKPAHGTINVKVA